MHTKAAAILSAFVALLMVGAVCAGQAKVIKTSTSNSEFSHGRALLALDDVGAVPKCFRTTKALGVPDFDWEAALGPYDKFNETVYATCPFNSQGYYCYGKGDKAYKKCIAGRFPIDECKLENQCTTSEYTLG